MHVLYAVMYCFNLCSYDVLCDIAAVHSDNSFEIYVDQNLVNSGSLLEDMRSLFILLVCNVM